MDVVGSEGPGACSVVVGEEGFRGADLRNVGECLGGFEKRGGGNLVRCFEGGDEGEIGQSCDAVNAEFYGAVWGDACI